ncbi:MAG: homocysteine S-methyltransferase family protein, partial [Planctomycetes bacterium]|nr:homocysteine S-methyltransferase family protein [Planctomycetota bacterium]
MGRISIKELVKERVVLLDGGMGTSLMKQGLASGKPGESWNLEKPEAIQTVHAGFFNAGSLVAQTNTFGGTGIRLENHGLAGQAREINQAAVMIARRAAGDDRWVAGNIGPSGRFLPPVGDGDPEILEAAYAEQAGWLAEAGADYISIETMLDLKEARIALKAAKQGAPGL